RLSLVTARSPRAGADRIVGGRRAGEAGSGRDDLIRRGIDPERVRRLRRVEEARFLAERPRSLALLERARRTMPRGVPMSWMDDMWEHAPVWIVGGGGARFSDVDGHEYLDMYLADMSGFCGHAPAPVVAAVRRRMERGNQFLLPSEDALAVGEHLARRYGMPKWQFTLSATQANTEVIRLAREATGREIVLVFDGKYHGHLDATLVVLEGDRVVPEQRGLPSSITGQARVVQFNDTSGLEAALAPRDVALVLLEPALTNAGVILPEAGFHDALRALCRATGTLVAIDETHTLVAAYGGLSREWGLEPDFLTLGKSIAAGVPLGAYGMTDAIAGLIAPPEEHAVVSGVSIDEVATGGTLFANALSMAAGRAALEDVLTEDAFERAGSLGARMADGLERAFEEAVPWSVARMGAHCYYAFSPEPPRDAIESRARDDPDLRALIRVFMANRGVWESGWWLGPTVSVAHTADDVDRYLEVFADFLSEATRRRSGPAS
ncbi:MAG TPA: transaminase, partial [Actinomycetota bacterium]|nr:transaminase [Actinomycetota bacterium]